MAYNPWAIEDEFPIDWKAEEEFRHDQAEANWDYQRGLEVGNDGEN